MRYDLFFQELKNIACQEMRSATPDYFEFVVKAADLPQVGTVLEKFFGPPLKPAGTKPSAEAKKLADAHGGIRADQTLYHVISEELYYYSLIWPWSNGQFVTVKVIRAA